MPAGLTASQISGYLTAVIQTSTPILLAAIGLIFSARAGIINIGVEGTMLIGSLMGFVGAYFTGSPWMGALLALLAGTITGLLFAYLVTVIKANQVVMGMAINLLGLGLTTSLVRIIFGIRDTMPRVNSFGPWPVPFLNKIPFLGQVLFNHSPLVYLTFLLVPFTWYLLFKTTIGLKIRAVGEHPRAADTVGIRVNQIRFICCIIDGAIAGVAGAYLSISLLSMFTENMVAGRGFIALAAVIFGKWNPVGVMGAALLFGLGDALQVRLQAQGINIPYQFLLMLPYIITIIALAGFIGRAVKPAAQGQPYHRDAPN